MTKNTSISPDLEAAKQWARLGHARKELRKAADELSQMASRAAHPTLLSDAAQRVDAANLEVQEAHHCYQVAKADAA